MPDITTMDRVLEDALKDVRKGKLYRRLRVFTEWPRIVGEGNALRARPVALRGKTLVVKSEDSAWANRLQFMEEDIKKRIAEQIGEGFVDRVRFIVGEMDGPPPAPERTQGTASDADRKKIAKWLAAPGLEGKDELKADLESLLLNAAASGSIREGKRNRKA